MSLPAGLGPQLSLHDEVIALLLLLCSSRHLKRKSKTLSEAPLHLMCPQVLTVLQGHVPSPCVESRAAETRRPSYKASSVLVSLWLLWEVSSCPLNVH